MSSYRKGLKFETQVIEFISFHLFDSLSKYYHRQVNSLSNAHIITGCDDIKNIFDSNAGQGRDILVLFPLKLHLILIFPNCWSPRSVFDKIVYFDCFKQLLSHEICYCQPLKAYSFVIGCAIPLQLQILYSVQTL